MACSRTIASTDAKESGTRESIFACIFVPSLLHFVVILSAVWLLWHILGVAVERDDHVLSRRILRVWDALNCALSGSTCFMPSVDITAGTRERRFVAVLAKQ